jgi:hypothetical protein
MRRKRDVDGADIWLRIIVAIGTLGTPPTDARHLSGDPRSQASASLISERNLFQLCHKAENLLRGQRPEEKCSARCRRGSVRGGAVRR